MPRFQPEEIFRILDRHGVEYIVIGGVAARQAGGEGANYYILRGTQ